MSEIKRVHVDLIKGLDEDGKKEIVRQLENSKRLLSRIRQIIHKEIENSYIDEEEKLEASNLIDVASTIGYRRGLRSVLKYLPEE